MTHIKTQSNAEKSMRDLYKQATDESPITAEEAHLAAIDRILENTRKMDLLKLEISKDMGSLMGYMQGHAALRAPDGQLRITWTNAADKSVVDYDAILLELNVPPATVARHTKTKPGARVFTIVD